MNCPHCHAVIAAGTRFCGECGRAAVATSEVAPAAEAPSDWVGREIVGRYRIKSKLGEGGMGAVFKAEQISLKRVIALKLLKPELVTSPTLLRRFNAEAEVVAKLNHPNTVGIYDFGQDVDGTLFIAMEFVEGKSLRAALIAEGPFVMVRALHVAGQISASLSDAHAVGIIHRDLKPDNIMLQERGKSRDVVRVLDFGIAKLRDDSRMTQQSMTQAGDVLGTPQYMSPEQIRGEDIDGRADIYSLGAILYEMLTGRMVFEANNLVAVLSKHLLDQPEPPSRRRPDLGISAEVDALVLSCLAKDPRARPPSMERVGELVTGMIAALGGLSSSGEQLIHAAGGGAGVPSPTPVSSAPSYAPPMTPPPPMPAAYSQEGAISSPGPAELGGAPMHGSPHGAPFPAAGPGMAPGYSPYAPMAQPQPPYVPQPVRYDSGPAPYGAAPPSPARRGLLLGLAALALLTAGGVGTYFLFGRSEGKSAPASPTEPSIAQPGAQLDPWGGAAADASPRPDVDHVALPDDPPEALVMRAPKIGNVGGTLFSASGFFRFLVPPEFSPQPQMQASPDGKSSRWTFSASHNVSISVLASVLPTELDPTDPETTATSFGQSLGMQLSSWRWRDIQGQKAVSGIYAAVVDGLPISAEAVLYIKPKGFLVVLFICMTPYFQDSKPYRDSLFTQRISW